MTELQTAREELARLERMTLAQRQLVVELERQADSKVNPWSHANLVVRRPPGFYEAPQPPFAVPPPSVLLSCQLTKGCWLGPGHEGHCD